jgi:Rrf2 family protein
VGDVENIFRISNAASLALHTMVLLAATPDEVVSNRDIAGSLNASEAHLSKVLQRLTKAGLVKSLRGPHGGFKLAKAAAEITLLDIYEAIEGPLISSNCLLASPVCIGNKCILGSLLKTMNSKLREQLAGTHLLKLAGTICVSGRNGGFDA